MFLANHAKRWIVKAPMIRDLRFGFTPSSNSGNGNVVGASSRLPPQYWSIDNTQPDAQASGLPLTGRGFQQWLQVTTGTADKPLARASGMYLLASLSQLSIDQYWSSTRNHLLLATVRPLPN
jgi:hypothetical protein